VSEIQGRIFSIFNAATASSPLSLNTSLTIGLEREIVDGFDCQPETVIFRQER